MLLLRRSMGAASAQAAGLRPGRNNASCVRSAAGPRGPAGQDRDIDMILVGGANVYPAEVEAALDEHPEVRSSCVIGLPDEDLGALPHAVVELAPAPP